MIQNWWWLLIIDCIWTLARTRTSNVHPLHHTTRWQVTSQWILQISSAGSLVWRGECFCMNSKIWRKKDFHVYIVNAEDFRLESLLYIILDAVDIILMCKIFRCFTIQWKPNWSLLLWLFSVVFLCGFIWRVGNFKILILHRFYDGISPTPTLASVLSEQSVDPPTMSNCRYVLI